MKFKKLNWYGFFEIFSVFIVVRIQHLRTILILNVTFFAGRNVANPTAILLASAKMLQHLGLNEEAIKVKTAVNKVLADQKVRTRDLGGFASTTQFTQAVVDNL